MSFNADVGAIGIGSTIAGGLAGAIGSLFGGSAQQQMYDYQAGIAKLNAQIAEQNAVYATQAGEAQAMQAGLAAGQQMGRIKAAQSATGLDVNSGTNKQVQQSQAGITSETLSAIRSNAAKTAYDYRVSAVSDIAQANLDTLAGQNARRAGMISAESSLIGMASSVSSEWLKGTQLKLWG